MDELARVRIELEHLKKSVYDLDDELSPAFTGIEPKSKI